MITALLVVGIMLLRDRPKGPVDVVQDAPVSGLAYCSEEQVRPCVVSFGIDADGAMLVNLLLPDLSFHPFFLKIVRDNVDINYTCLRVGASPNNAYCMGEKLPPGELLHLMLVSERDGLVLAEGDLSIIGLAFPTLEIAIATPQRTSTASVASPTPTQLPVFVLPTSSATQSSYPNPSYPNPSYP
ncbi:MAG TPA: hypothetical protein VIS72_01510 [Anaerolineales bacterium]